MSEEQERKRPSDPYFTPVNAPFLMSLGLHVGRWCRYCSCPEPRHFECPWVDGGELPHEPWMDEIDDVPSRDSAHADGD